jgi:hypothetical protein
MADLGRTLIVIGIGSVVVGLLLMVLPRMPWLGHLPGDIHVERENFSLHVPLVTCLLVSIVATVILNLLTKR